MAKARSNPMAFFCSSPLAVTPLECKATQRAAGAADSSSSPPRRIVDPCPPPAPSRLTNHVPRAAGVMASSRHERTPSRAHLLRREGRPPGAPHVSQSVQSEVSRPVGRRRRSALFVRHSSFASRKYIHTFHSQSKELAGRPAGLEAPPERTHARTRPAEPTAACGRTLNCRPRRRCT
ncbi:uncharacterized protein J3D65DRAFT_629656 [Phyllosticta citribraziliensis]|uniref:Uncharacterized protein n=1 Tax=Phyllosticta citribraziliensis TaxID=989973 RepID=A0ABR1LIG4_9PEZI